MMRAHVQDPPIPLNQRVSGLRFPTELDTAIKKSLEKSRDKRYATAVDFAHALRACLKSSMASTAARRALPSDPAPSPAPPTASSMAPRSRAPSATALTADADAPVVPVTRGPMIVIFAALAVVLLGLGVWLGASLGQ